MARTQLADVADTDWAYVLRLLPEDLDKLAAETGAIQRRRSVASAAHLLRLLLAYGAGDWSFRQTASMSEDWGGKRISDVALLNRLRTSAGFLRALVSSVIARRLDAAQTPAGRVCIVDGTAIRRPGSKGADWRLHLSYDLGQQQLMGVELTPAAEGESLTRLNVDPNCTYLADRGYGTTPGVLHLLRSGARFVVRITPQNIRLRSASGDRLDLMEWLQSLPDATVGERVVCIEGSPQELRLVAVRKSRAAAERAQRLAAREGRRHGGAIRPQTLTLAAYTLVITNCTDYSPTEVLEVYRFRWQIECAIKRLKSILQLDALRAQDADIAQAYLLAKILAALLVEELTTRAVLFSPWGYRRPLSA